MYTWEGVGANEDEQIVATNTATVLAGAYKGTGGRVIIALKEGQASVDAAQFWVALGGKSE